MLSTDADFLSLLVAALPKPQASPPQATALVKLPASAPEATSAAFEPPARGRVGADIEQLDARLVTLERLARAKNNAFSPEMPLAAQEVEEATSGKDPSDTATQLLALGDELRRLKCRFEYLELCAPPHVQRALDYFEPLGPREASPGDSAGTGESPRPKVTAEEAKATAEDVRHEFANVSLSVRGLQRDTETQAGKLQDLMEVQKSFRERLEAGLAQLLTALKDLMQRELHNETLAADSLAKAQAFLADTDGAHSESHPFVSKAVFQSALAATEETLQDSLQRMREDILTALGGKADSAQLRSLVVRMDAESQQSPLRSATVVEEGRLAAAVTRAPSRGAACLSCETRADVVVESRAVPNPPFPARINRTPSAPQLRFGGSTNRRSDANGSPQSRVLLPSLTSSPAKT